MNIKKEEIKFIPVDKLKLDPENPRLPSNIGRTQKEMIQYLADSTSLSELMSAISENGYFPGEPVVAIPDDSDDDYIVVEGNRRLSAVKILNDYKILDSYSQTIEKLSENSEYIDSIPVVIKNTRDEILPYLGYRHITGVKQWEPLAKARYIRQLYDRSQADNNSDKYTEIAQSIGSRSNYIRRNLEALAVYDEIESQDFYGIEGLDEQSLKFSILSTALADNNIAQFVGLRTDSNDSIENISSLKSSAIRELTKWLFKKENGATRIGESRNLRKLSAVVNNDKALLSFRNGSNLEISYRLTSAANDDFAQLLSEAENSLVQALSLLSTIDYSEPMYDLAKQISKHIKTIGKNLKDKRNGEDDDF